MGRRKRLSGGLLVSCRFLGIDGDEIEAGGRQARMRVIRSGIGVGAGSEDVYMCGEFICT